MASKWMNELLKRYTIGGDVDAICAATIAQPNTQVLLEKAGRLIQGSERPTRAQMAFMVNLISIETPSPVKMAILTTMVRLLSELEMIDAAFGDASDGGNVPDDDEPSGGPFGPGDAS